MRVIQCTTRVDMAAADFWALRMDQNFDSFCARFDNTDMETFDGMPAPTGSLNLMLVGGNALLDKLVAMGFAHSVAAEAPAPAQPDPHLQRRVGLVLVGVGHKAKALRLAGGPIPHEVKVYDFAVPAADTNTCQIQPHQQPTHLFV